MPLILTRYISLNVSIMKGKLILIKYLNQCQNELIKKSLNVEVGSQPFLSASQVCGRCVQPVGWGGLCTFCFPHSIWFLSAFRNIPPDKHPGSQPWSWAPAPCLWKTTSTAFWLASPPTQASHAQGLLPCSAHSWTLYCTPYLHQGHFSNNHPLLPEELPMTVPLPSYIREETLTAHPYYPVPYFWSM